MKSRARLALFSLISIVATSCTGARDLAPHQARSNRGIVFGVSGSEAVEWAERAKWEPLVELVTKQGFGDGSRSWVAVRQGEIDKHARSAEYILVRRWFTVSQLKEIASLTAPVWPDFAKHLLEDIEDVSLAASPQTNPPNSDTQTRFKRRSAVEQYNDRTLEELLKPREAGGFGAIGCGLRSGHRGATFIPVIRTPGVQELIDKVKLGQSVSAGERQRYDQYRSSEAALRTIKGP